MHRPDLRRHDSWSPVSRRQAILGIGSVAAGSTALAVAATDRAAAAVSVESLSVPDASFTAESIDPKLVVDIGFSYDVGSEGVGAIRFGVAVDDSEIASEELNTTKAVFEGDTTLSGLLTDSDEWASEDFTVSVGESVDREIAVTVTFDVLDTGGNVLVSDTASDSAVVTVSHPQASAWTASVGGQGEIIDASE